MFSADLLRFSGWEEKFSRPGGKEFRDHIHHLTRLHFATLHFSRSPPTRTTSVTPSAHNVER